MIIVLQISIYLSAAVAAKLLDFIQLPGRHDLIALGSTYRAISPLLLPFSTQMLAPHARHPARIHPVGPSQKSCEMYGK
jgi:hypothetical protein